jgi:hypothetical protein
VHKSVTSFGKSFQRELAQKLALMRDKGKENMQILCCDWKSSSLGVHVATIHKSLKNDVCAESLMQLKREVTGKLDTSDDEAGKQYARVLVRFISQHPICAFSKSNKQF